MRLSIASVPGERRGAARAGESTTGLLVASRRHMAALMAMLILVATVGVMLASSARADTVFQSGQVFASVGFSEADVYDAGSANQIASLVDNTNSQYTAGSAFDANGNFYVADGSTGDISEYSPSGAPLPTFATGLANPEALVFDSSGNLYVGQVRSPYIAEFSPSGQRLADIGPLTTELYGDDWIDLSSDQCTFYYTSERSDIMRYNKCTNTQLPNFNQAPLPGPAAFELRILPNGQVLVADSSAVVLLDATGSVVTTYSCASLPGCQGQLYALALDPSGTSFWVGDAYSGLVWKVQIANQPQDNLVAGQVLQTIDTQAAYLYGLSVEGEVTAATSQTTVAATPTSLAVLPVTGNFSSPTPVSAVLTDSATDTPISGEQVTFTLNGTENCTATTDSNGIATCVITPGEPSSSYTLTASFSGDSSQSTPIGSDSTSSAFTVNPDTSSLTYTGPTTAVNGSPITLSGTLTSSTPTSGTPLPNDVVTFTIGSQSCSGTTDGSGNASCTIPSVNQTVSSVPITTSFAGDVYDTSASTSTPATVTEPTTLTVQSATSDYADATTVSGVLTDTLTTTPIVGEPVTLKLNNTESCTGTTDPTGTATCSITPGEAAATYPLTGSFGGDSTRPLQLMASNGSANFVVTLEQTALSYTGAVTAQNGQPLAVSGVLTTDDPTPTTPIPGRTVTFTLGTGSSAQSCSGTTDSTGKATCNIAPVSQSPGPIPVVASFGGDAYYQMASAASTVNLPEGTQLTVTPTTGTYNGSTPVSATLVNTYTNQPVPNEPVTFTLNNTQTCTATTNASGVATCPVTPTEPAGTYSLTTSFPGDSGSMPQLLPNGSSSTFTVTPATTTLTYTGTTSVTNGQSATLSGVLTTNEPSPGTDVAGSTVTFTLGSGSSAQSCTATTNASGAASCTIASVNQSSGSVPISTSFGGNSDYKSSSTASSATVHTPTTLTVNAGTSDFADAGTVSAVLTNKLTGAGIAGEPVTLTLNSTQSCTGITNASGVASCSITPNEPAATYSLTASFGGDTSKAPQLLASSGSNKFVVTLEETAITYTGPSIAVSGTPFTMSAHLTTDDPTAATPLAGRAVLMTLGSGSTAQSCTGTTNAAGNASCTIGNVSGGSGGCHQTAGSAPVSVTFAGDAYYRPAGASGTVTIAAIADTGGFVIGDKSAGTPPSPMAPYSMVTSGKQVNFWGSQLWKTNQFSGVNNAPASMKGYIDNAPSNLGQPGQPNAYGCGKTWTSDPGNSSHPPSTVPTNLVVVVSSHINQSGSTESGDVEHVVVVSVAPGYGPAPGHDGYGKIIAWLC
jgi:hypothetical protein